MTRSIARLDGLDSADARDLLEPEDARDADDDDAIEPRGDMDAEFADALRSREGADGADRDTRPDSAARGVASASELVVSLSTTMSLKVSVLYFLRWRFEGRNDAGSGVEYKRFDALAPVAIFAAPPSSHVGLDTAIQCSMPAVLYMLHLVC